MFLWTPNQHTMTSCVIHFRWSFCFNFHCTRFFPCSKMLHRVWHCSWSIFISWIYWPFKSWITNPYNVVAVWYDLKKGMSLTFLGIFSSNITAFPSQCEAVNPIFAKSSCWGVLRVVHSNSALKSQFFELAHLSIFLFSPVLLCLKFKTSFAPNFYL